MNKALALALLRVSLGGLLLAWGLDKIVNTEHGLAVSDKFYGGLLSVASLMPMLGVIQSLLGLLVIVGWQRRWVYPVQLAVNSLTLLVVFGSVIDPLGWYLEGTNLLFYPSLIVFAASLVVMAFRTEDRYALDAARQSATGVA